MGIVDLLWELKSFKELNSFELYAILKLRSQVFVVEQNCVFLDMDNKDYCSYHLMGWNNKDLAAYSRLIPPGKVFKEMTIGRVVTSPNYRNKGTGKELLTISIKECYKLFGEKEIKIGAQFYLKKFYSSFGFIQCSDIYDEDGIDHIQMVKQGLKTAILL